MAARRSDVCDLTRWLYHWSCEHNVYHLNAEVTHVTAYLEFSGDMVGLPGVGGLRGPNFGRIPIVWTAEQLLNTEWVRIIRPPVGEETCEMGVHVERMEPNWRPAQIKFFKADGRHLIATPMDTAKSCGADYIMLSKYVLPIDDKKEVAPPTVDLDGISTPPSPPMNLE